MTNQVSNPATVAAGALRKARKRPSSKYVLISPVRDEEQYIAKTLESVIRQTIRPVEWLLIDDGSRDRTGAIIDDYAKQHPWIIALHRKDRGRRLAGAGVMQAFHEAYDHLRCPDWQYIGKLDGDVGLEPDYFEQCIKRFDEDSRLGICGGLMYCENKGELKIEKHRMDHVRGAIKLYRRSCWVAIGGLITSTGWDTVDEVHANMLGWLTKSFPELTVVQHRPTGAAVGPWRDNVKNGRADYICGYHPFFVFLKCIRRLCQRPYVGKSLAHAYGYISGYAEGIARIENQELIRYVRAQQMKRLLFAANNHERSNA